MPFTLAEPIMPTTIDGITVILYVNPRGSLQNGGQGLVQSVMYDVEVMNAEGTRMRVMGDIGDLVPHLTPEQITWLQQFMTDLRTLANSAFLGT